MTEYNIPMDLCQKHDIKATVNGFMEIASISVYDENVLCDGFIVNNANTLVLNEFDEENSHKFGMPMMKQIGDEIILTKEQIEFFKKYVMKIGGK